MAPLPPRPPTAVTPRRHRAEPTAWAVGPWPPIVFVTTNAFLRERLRAAFHEDDRIAVVDAVSDGVGRSIELAVDALVLDVSRSNRASRGVSQTLTTDPAAAIAVKGTAAADRRATRTESGDHADASGECRGREPGMLLTSREMQVVSAVAAGYRNRDIAALLAITESTVKHHLANIFDKVGVSSRLELAMFAQHHGLE